MEFGHELSAASLFKLLSFLFWGFLYIWCTEQFSGQSPEWYSRAITLVHGSVATCVGLSQCRPRSVTPGRLTMKIKPWHYALMVWSWGYFAFDLLWCLVYRTESNLILCHHVSALLAITIYMQKEYKGCTFACTLALLEVSNPLLQARWFLRSGGYQKTLIYIFVEVTYLALFLTMRGVLGTYLVYKILHSDLFDTDEKLISLVFYFVSIAFIYEIIGYLLHKHKDVINIVSELMDHWGILLNEL